MSQGKVISRIDEGDTHLNLVFNDMSQESIPIQSYVCFTPNPSLCEDRIVVTQCVLLSEGDTLLDVFEA